MVENERLNTVVNILRRDGAVSVHALAAQLFVSEATIRRDLSQLEEQGLVRRMHGSAILTGDTSTELSINSREQQHINAKMLIARKACQFIRSGQLIFIDASSTAMYICRFLERFQSLTIVTNSIRTAQELSQSQHSVILTGGTLLHNAHALVGPQAIEAVRRYNADACFFSSRGVSEDGLITDPCEDEVTVRRAMIEHSRQRIYMCDKSKFGNTYRYNLGNTSQMDCFLTED